MKTVPALYENKNSDSSGEDSTCPCFGKSKLKGNFVSKKKRKSFKNKRGKKVSSLKKSQKITETLSETDITMGKMSKESNATPSDVGEKILAKGDPGMGKTTWCKKVAYDWVKGLFQTFSIVFFVFLKLVKLGAAIENIIIEQNPYMKGLKITKRKLESVLETFGNRCLLILDGLDEHALGMNKDVLGIIRGEKLLSCNIIVTSRSHSIKEIEKYFPVILRVEGFTYEKAKRFASKILNDEKSIQAILRFKPTDFIRIYIYYNDDDDPIYRCPILLSFLCLLVREDAIDLSTTDMHVGEIYLRMVRCLYKKFTIRKSISFERSEFNRITMLIGKLAYETLLSGNPLLQKSRVLAEVGEDAFDYGLLIGHEDAHRLIRDITADIFITFPQRSLQEFLRAFFFIRILDENSEFTPSDNYISIFLINPLFLQFCLWLLKSDKKHKNLKNASVVYECLIDNCTDVMNHLFLNTRYITRTYPVFDISSALMNNDNLLLSFFRDILAKCDKVRHIIVESATVLKWMLITSTVKTAKIIEYHDHKIELRYSKQVCVESKRLSSSDVSVRSDTDFKTLHHKCRHPIESPTVSSGYYHLTHLVTGKSYDDKYELSEVVKRGGLQDLTHLCIEENNCVECVFYFLFQSVLPKLKHLDLSGTFLEGSDLNALCLACNAEEKILPHLSSLRLELIDVRTNHFFVLSWLNLNESYLYLCEPRLTDKDDCLWVGMDLLL